MSSDNFTIRLATSNDAAAIADIYNEAIHTTTATFDMEPKTAEDRLQWLHAHDERHPVFVAELDGQIVGWACLTKWSDRPAYDQTAELLGSRMELLVRHPAKPHAERFGEGHHHPR